jgi:hypothetical protein
MRSPATSAAASGIATAQQDHSCEQNADLSEDCTVGHVSHGLGLSKGFRAEIVSDGHPELNTMGLPIRYYWAGTNQNGTKAG